MEKIKRIEYLYPEWMKTLFCQELISAAKPDVRKPTAHKNIAASCIDFLFIAPPLLHMCPENIARFSGLPILNLAAALRADAGVVSFSNDWKKRVYVFQ